MLKQLETRLHFSDRGPAPRASADVGSMDTVVTKGTQVNSLEAGELS